MSRYIDDYGECGETYATLTIWPGMAHPEEVTMLLGILPTRMTVGGSLMPPRRDGSARPPHLARWPHSVWSLSSDGSVQSGDLRRHIDWVLDHLLGKEGEVVAMLDRGWEAQMTCFWRSSSGHGGPILDPPLMRRLVDLGIGLYIDCYDSLPEEVETR